MAYKMMELLRLPSSSAKSLLLYGVITLVSSLLSRIVMTKFFFDYPIVLIMFQMALTLMVIEVGRLIKVLKVQAYTFQRGKDMFLPSLFYSLSQYITLNCLDGISLPFFPFIQKFFPLLVLIFYFLILRRQRPSFQTFFVLFILCLGAAMSSVFEMNFDIWALLYSVTALLMLTASMVLVERLHEQSNASAMEIIYMNSFNCLCIFLIADIVQDEMRDAYMYLQTSSTGVFTVCLVLLVLAMALGHAALLYCITCVNALNTAIAYNCSSAVQVIVASVLSIEVFYDVEPDWYNIFGVGLAIAATSFYFISARDRELKMSGPQGKYQMIVEKS